MCTSKLHESARNSHPGGKKDYQWEKVKLIKEECYTLYPSFSSGKRFLQYLRLNITVYNYWNIFLFSLVLLRCRNVWPSKVTTCHISTCSSTCLRRCVLMVWNSIISSRIFFNLFTVNGVCVWWCWIFRQQKGNKYEMNWCFVRFPIEWQGARIELFPLNCAKSQDTF